MLSSRLLGGFWVSARPVVPEDLLHNVPLDVRLAQPVNLQIAPFRQSRPRNRNLSSVSSMRSHRFVSHVHENGPVRPARPRKRTVSSVIPENLEAQSSSRGIGKGRLKITTHFGQIATQIHYINRALLHKLNSNYYTNLAILQK